MRRHLRDNAIAIVAGCFALILVIARACLQSVTLDESNLYLGYVAPDWPSHWYPTSGNHVLLSILDRLFIYLFGLSQLTFRAPTLIGAVVYLIAVYQLCVLLISTKMLRLATYLCLVYNPFILDYLVAARGYGLALGFLMTAILMLSRQVLAGPQDPQIHRRFVWASICAGLTLSACFPFAYVCVILLILFASWACWEQWKLATPSSRIPQTLRILAACSLPGLLVVFFLCGSVLLEFPRSQLYYGALSISESWKSLVGPVFYELNPYIANPLVSSTLLVLLWPLTILFVTLVILQFALIVLCRPWRKNSEISRLAINEALLLSTIALTAAAHLLAFKTLRIPLPQDRTGLFFVPLSVVGIALGVELYKDLPFGRALQAITACVLWLGVTYFAACMRLSYFHEWKFDADVKSAYWALDYLRRQYHITESFADWRYAQPLNFYRAYYSDASIPFFHDLSAFPPGKCSYVLDGSGSAEFIKQEQLGIFYRGPISQLVIAVRDSPECR